MAITIMCLLCAFASFAESNIRLYHFKNIDHTFDSIAALVLTDEFNRNMNDTAALRIKELRKSRPPFLILFSTPAPHYGKSGQPRSMQIQTAV